MPSFFSVSVVFTTCPLGRYAPTVDAVSSGLTGNPSQRDATYSSREPPAGIGHP